MITGRLLLGGLFLTLHHAPQRPAVDAHRLVQQAITAMQGTGSLAQVRAVRSAGTFHEYLLGNAERAEGPWRIQYATFDELRDATGERIRRVDRPVPASLGSDRVSILVDSVMTTRSGAREAGSNQSAYDAMTTRIVSNPDRVLALAAASTALRWDRTVTHYGINFDVVSFPWNNGRIRIEISQVTHFPTALEIVRPYPDDFRWAVFGDVTVRTELVDWNVQPSGVWWPMQQTAYFNGQPLRDVTVTSVTLDSTAAPADSFAVSDSARAQFGTGFGTSFARLRVGARGPLKELAKDIVRVPDQWTMTMVKQDDGVVLFESHISGQWLDDVIAEAHKRYPGTPVKAIVMTSDPWAHLGGFRQAVARGIPIYVKDASIPFLTALAKSPHEMAPDLLAKNPRAPKFIPVSGKTVIGTGANQIVLYPVHGEYAERMLMAYFPAKKLLYGADLIFPKRSADGKSPAGFSDTEARDLRSAIIREKLDVDAVFCVQGYPLFDGAAFMRNEGKLYVAK